MMDFDIAARRLQQDQKSAYAKSRASRTARGVSTKAKKEALAARHKAEQRLRQKRLEGERNAKIVDRVVSSVKRVERQLGVANVSSPVVEEVVSEDKQLQSSSPTSSSSLFANINSPISNGFIFKTPTSIFGDGDKIALPPSILQTMTSSTNDMDPWGSTSQGGRPIAFRIGIKNQDYKFPASDKMKVLVEDYKKEIISSEKKNALMTHHENSSSVSVTDDSNINGDNVMEDSDDDDDTDESQIIEAYLDELSYRYLSYTHSTVVEFTQEEDCVGLPESIARSLLQPNSHSLVGARLLTGNKIDIPVKRTVDPSAFTNAKEINDNNEDDDSNMEVDNTNNETVIEDTDEGGEKTPGHPAYGVFDIPNLPIEVTPISLLPPGRNCTFTPTQSSIQNGFYSLKNIKEVLEQSLMRTRATLSKGDVIRTWRRGVSFDLIVSSLSPAQFGAVSCINTNLNVDIGPPEGETGKAENNNNTNQSEAKKTEAKTLGRLLSEPTSQTTRLNESTVPQQSKNDAFEQLPPEPAESVKEGICNVQIRGRTPSGNSTSGRRRFDIRITTIGQLFAFASYVCEGAVGFRLVTRFPRKVFAIGDEVGCFSPNMTLEDVGIGQGQEMFMVEEQA